CRAVLGARRRQGEGARIGAAGQGSGPRRPTYLRYVGMDPLQARRVPARGRLVQAERVETSGQSSRPVSSRLGSAESWGQGRSPQGLDSGGQLASELCRKGRGEKGSGRAEVAGRRYPSFPAGLFRK